jgi:hypothetical protein
VETVEEIVLVSKAQGIMIEKLAIPENLEGFS